MSLFRVWECARCRTRYGQVQDVPLSSCPRCKSDDRSPLATKVDPVRPASAADYVDLWRFASGSGLEAKFITILARGNAVELTRCPVCHLGTWAHAQECVIRRLMEIERLAVLDGKLPGGEIWYRCGSCGGATLTTQVHAGIAPLTHPCVCSIACKGTMAVDQNPPSRSETPRFYWVRPTDVDPNGEPERAHRILVEGLLELVPKKEFQPQGDERSRCV